MTERLDHISSGAVDEKNAVIEDCLSDSATLPIWAPVVQKTAMDATGLVTVGTTTSVGDVVYGVTVGPLQNATSGYVATAIGALVHVLKRGVAKLKVLGNGSNIAINDALVSSGTAGKAVNVKGQATLNNATYGVAAVQGIGNAFAYALYASAADNDIIPVWVNGSRGNIS